MFLVVIRLGFAWFALIWFGFGWFALWFFHSLRERTGSWARRIRPLIPYNTGDWASSRTCNGHLPSEGTAGCTVHVECTNTTVPRIRTFGACINQYMCKSIAAADQHCTVQLHYPGKYRSRLLSERPGGVLNNPKAEIPPNAPGYTENSNKNTSRCIDNAPRVLNVHKKETLECPRGDEFPSHKRTKNGNRCISPCGLVLILLYVFQACIRRSCVLSHCTVVV